MVEDASVAQARELLGALYDHVRAITEKLEAAEHRHRVAGRGAGNDHRQEAALRRDLYEAHRHIDRLHRRFPETDDRSPSTHRRPATALVARPRV